MVPFISSLTVKNYGCARDVCVQLTPLHAFVGPNDSGKSTLLRAARTLVYLGSGLEFSSDVGPVMHWRPFDPGMPFELGMTLEANYDDGRSTKVVFTPTGVERATQGYPPVPHPMGWWEPKLGRMVRFDPDALREPGRPVPEGKASVFADDRGAGLPGVFDRLLNRGDDTFLRIVEDVRNLFPTIKALRFTVNDEGAKEFEVELKDGKRVPGRFLSEGLLYYLGFAALQHLEPTPLLLVEEPENGLHPARIAEVMRLLREISKTTQVLIATHSPLVVNELGGDEVTVVIRDEVKGTQVRRLSETPHFSDRSKVYAPGELWLSYANGDDEAPLLQGSANGSAG